MQKILLVEDEDEIREIERDYLKNDKFGVIEARHGKEALDLFDRQKVDLVVLDLNLPIVDGIEVCKRIRAQSPVPIIMVTARTKEIDELLGLEVGADDYIKKPFSPKVFVARVKALLKRPAVTISSIIKIGDLRINPEKRVVMKKDKIINLTSVQFNILLLMSSQKGKVFSRDELIERGYDDNLPPDIFDRTIDSHIKNIRKLIEESSRNPKYILTVRSIGYKVNDEI